MAQKLKLCTELLFCSLSDVNVGRDCCLPATLNDHSSYKRSNISISIFGILCGRFSLTDRRGVVVLSETCSDNRQTAGQMDHPRAVGCCSMYCALWAGRRICMLQVAAVVQTVQKYRQVLSAGTQLDKGFWPTLTLREIKGAQTDVGTGGSY